MFFQRFSLSLAIMFSLLLSLSQSDVSSDDAEYVYIRVTMEDKSNNEDVNAITACEDSYAAALKSAAMNLLDLTDDSVTVYCIRPMNPDEKGLAFVDAIIEIGLSSSSTSATEIISHILDDCEDGSQAQKDAINEFGKQLSNSFKYYLDNNNKNNNDCNIKLQMSSIEREDSSLISYGMVSLDTTGVGYEDAQGTVYFEENRQLNLMKITYDISGLTAGYHGFHIHTYGDLRQGCTSTGGHYNPFGFNHGSPSDVYRHIGDLGNIMADDYGNAYGVIYDNLATFFGDYNVGGRAVVVHAGEDDLGQGGDSGSLATGNAGGRVTCGVIVIVASF